MKVDVEVFQDPKFCCNPRHYGTRMEGKESRCPYYYGSECELFRNEDGEMYMLLKIDGTPIKTESCKRAYQESINQDENSRAEFDCFWSKIATTHTEEDKAFGRMFWNKSRDIPI